MKNLFKKIMDEEFATVKSAKGEGPEISYRAFQDDEIIIPKSLTYEDASRCLHMLGKDESGMRYAYLMLTAIERKLTEISVILKFNHILFLDLTGNKLNLEALQCLVCLPYLLYLKVERNLIESVELNPCTFLQVLNFSRNKIISTENLKQPALECLDLNYNFVEVINLETRNVPVLKLLEVRGNLLTNFSGFYPSSLDSLYLAQNRISNLDEDSLRFLVNLRVLHLRDNLIQKLDGLCSSLTKLKYLNVRMNRIGKLRQLYKLKILPNLETLIILQNPVGGEEEPLQGEGAGMDFGEELGEEEEILDKFRVSVLILLPDLKRLNKKPVTALERLAAERQRMERFGEIMDEASSIVKDDFDEFLEIEAEEEAEAEEEEDENEFEINENEIN